jgi:parallel beta-helix repeat protein
MAEKGKSSLSRLSSDKSLLISAAVFTLLLAGIFAPSMRIEPAKAERVADLMIPYVAKSSEVIVDGELNDTAWNFAVHFHNQSENVKTIEFDAYLMHDSESMYIGAKIYNNDFWDRDGLGDYFEVEINDRNDGHYGGRSGDDVKRILVTLSGLGSYQDDYMPYDEAHDSHQDGAGSFSFSGTRREGELGDYSFEMKIPINGSHPEDAALKMGTPFGMDISFTDYDSSLQDQGRGYWILQGSYLLEVTSRPRAVTVPDDYATIQQAINNANAGDTIYVKPGTYVENVVVNTTVTLIGKDRDSTVVSSPSINIVVFNITAPNVIITNFTISGGQNGVLMGQGSTVSFGKIISNGIGIVTHENGSFIHDNEIGSNDVGVALEGGSGLNVVRNNIIEENGWNGITMEYSTANYIFGNNISQNGWNPNDYPQVSGGIFYHDSSNNTIAHNNIIDNHRWQVNDYAFRDHRFPVSLNTWDMGYPAGGNFWSDYTDVDVYSGEYQNETGSDGRGDSPYIVNANNTDRYPLMQPYAILRAPTPGDLNQDGRVDLLDAIAVAEVFGLQSGDPRWDAEADLNQDGVIDVLDVIIVANNFGKQYS